MSLLQTLLKTRICPSNDLLPTSHKSFLPSVPIVATIVVAHSGANIGVMLNRPDSHTQNVFVGTWRSLVLWGNGIRFHMHHCPSQRRTSGRRESIYGVRKNGQWKAMSVQGLLTMCPPPNVHKPSWGATCGQNGPVTPVIPEKKRGKLMWLQNRCGFGVPIAGRIQSGRVALSKQRNIGRHPVLCFGIGCVLFFFPTGCTHSFSGDCGKKVSTAFLSFGVGHLRMAFSSLFSPHATYTIKTSAHDLPRKKISDLRMTLHL